MRMLLLTPLLLVGACNVSTNPANNSVTVQYNAETAANVSNEVENTAVGIGNAIGNEASETVNKVNNSKIVVHTENRSSNTTENRQ
jgi:hypothetical protein